MEEIWKEIPDFPDYEVSDLGRVRSFKRATARVLKPSNDGRYQSLALMRDGKKYRHRIGRLVLLAFMGPLSDGMEMCHNDGDSLNDQLDNLRYDTHNANMQDMFKHGRSSGPRSKLGQEEVYTIRVKFASGKHSRTELARKYQVSEWTIFNVLMRQRAYKGGSGPIQKPCARLSKQQVETIREERASGKTLAGLADKYDVSESMISRIALGYRHSDAAGPRVQPYEIISSNKQKDEFDTQYSLQDDPQKYKLNVWIYCACGCGEIRQKYSRGKLRRFMSGHHY